jgi:pimeloyl-ACP methyl ester carboxylesterase
MLSIDSANNSSQKIKLPDGRSLAFAEYGDPKGSPIFLFHGTPGSRLFRHPDESIITSMNVRLITPERPGFGLSDFQQDRKILDWPDDLLVLADALGLASFGIIGYSGGGPHAAACALRIPNRLSGAVMVSSPSPLNTSDDMAGMVWLNRVLFGLARDSYALAKLSWWVMNAAYNRNPNAFMDFLADLSPESERVILRRPDIRTMLIEDFAEAHRTSINGAAWEILLLARDWGFQPEDIIMDVDLWQGEEDVRTPVSMGRALAAAIPNARAKFVPGEGHDVLYLHWKEILLSLLSRQPEAETPPRASGEKKRLSPSRRKPDPVEAKPSRTQGKARTARVTTDGKPQASDEKTDLVSTGSNSSRDE